MEEVAHDRLDVMEQLIVSPLFNELSVKVGEFNGSLTPFLNQEKTGDAPPLFIEVVNVIGVPKQILFAEAEITTLGVAGTVTVILSELLLAIFPVIQVAFEERTQFIISPLTSELSM